MQRKKSRFIVFLLSFFPGAGEMYMGFMKMGLSLMLGFMILTVIVGLTNLGALGVFAVAMYAYSFFHANNLATLDDRTFHSIRDEYLFGMGTFDNRKVRLEGRNRKVAAGILIVLGIMMLWQVIFNLLCDIFGWDNRFLSAVYYFVRDELPRAVVGIGVIWAGFALIRGKRIAIEDKDAAADEWTDRREQQPAEDWMRHMGPQQTNAWTAGGPQPTENVPPVHVRRPAGNGQMPAHDNTATGGQMPVHETQPVADGRIIYGEGPVADVQNLPENRN